MTLSHRKQHGFLSTDGLMWLALIVVALGFILTVSWRMLGSSDVVIEQSNISTLIANTQKLKSSTGYGPSGTNLVPALINLEGTGTMGINGTTLINQFNGTVTVVSNGMTFTITETNVPKNACITLSSKLAKSKQTSTSINGGSNTNGEILATDASTRCASDANTIAWNTY